jgi:hypothetical protein
MNESYVYLGMENCNRMSLRRVQERALYLCIFTNPSTYNYMYPNSCATFPNSRIGRDRKVLIQKGIVTVCGVNLLHS